LSHAVVTISNIASVVDMLGQNLYWVGKRMGKRMECLSKNCESRWNI